MQILLPLKEFAAAKQRLAGVLSAAERAQLFEAMIEDALQVLTQHSAIQKIAICSRDQAARWLANYYGVEFIDETQWPVRDLNTAVNTAARELFARGENDVLIVHGDLPLLSATDISGFLQVHSAHNAPAVTIAPDRRGTGTNLMAWRALPNFVTRYGENSFSQHCAHAREFNIEPTICDLPGARCDIDNPDDLLLLLEQRAPANTATKTRAFLRSSGIDERLRTMQSSANILPSSLQSGDDRERA